MYSKDRACRFFFSPTSYCAFTSRQSGRQYFPFPCVASFIRQGQQSKGEPRVRALQPGDKFWSSTFPTVSGLGPQDSNERAEPATRLYCTIGALNEVVRHYIAQDAKALREMLWRKMRMHTVNFTVCACGDGRARPARPRG